MRERVQAQLTLTKEQHILEAAARVFAEKGFHAANVRDIAAEAGVAHGSIYTYFENKEALLLGLFDLMSARTRLEATALLVAGTDPQTQLRNLLRHPLAALTQGKAELARIVLSEALVNRAFALKVQAQILEPMVRDTSSLLEQLLFVGMPKPPDFELRVRALTGLVFGTLVQRLLGDRVLEDGWEDLPDVLAELLTRGMQGERP